jgi:hypothetical protein
LWFACGGSVLTVSAKPEARNIELMTPFLKAQNTNCFKAKAAKGKGIIENIV